ncbi:MAG: DNA repair protein RadA [Actinobacteria bacterium]|nr:DNA repair protein RadA [Actinomycetota bacterium]
MSKVKYIVRCQECGYQSHKWMGRCPDCGEWNTMVEEAAPDTSTFPKAIKTPFDLPQQIFSVPSAGNERISTNIKELDRVLGGGLVPGAFILFGGEPGIGKSTLLLQISNNIADSNGSVLLVSGEESASQIKMRAVRLGALSKELYVLSETNLENIEAQIEEINPFLLVIDSIQTMYYPLVASAPGSVSQVRECTAQLMRIAKNKNLITLITGHVTKEGAIAGPRVLEHMVDTVLYFEGERHQSYRIIRAVKNRYGSTNEIGIFEMHSNGLVEVDNPSIFFIGKKSFEVAGSMVVVTMEGTRPILVELQSLVTPSYLTVPRRLVSGVDFNRFLLTLAVLERRAGLHLEREDVFVNAVGGIRITEPAGDLGIAAAVISAHRDINIPCDMISFGEISLSGEVRFVSHIERRLKEAARLGFKKAIIPAQNCDKLDQSEDIQVFPVNTLDDVIGVLMENVKCET